MKKVLSRVLIVLTLAAAAKTTGVPEAELELRSGHIVRTANGEALTSLAKLLRSLHFSDKAELVMTTHYYEPPSKHQDKSIKGDVSAAYAWAAANLPRNHPYRIGPMNVTQGTVMMTGNGAAALGAAG